MRKGKLYKNTFVPAIQITSLFHSCNYFFQQEVDTSLVQNPALTGEKSYNCKKEFFKTNNWNLVSEVKLASFSQFQCEISKN